VVFLTDVKPNRKFYSEYPFEIIFAAPEVAQNVDDDTFEPTIQSDLWSVGMIFIELFEQRLPWALDITPDKNEKEIQVDLNKCEWFANLRKWASNPSTFDFNQVFRIKNTPIDVVDLLKINPRHRKFEN